MILVLVQTVLLGMAAGFGGVLGVSLALLLVGFIGAKLLGGQKRGG